MNEFLLFILLLVWLVALALQVYALGYDNGERDSSEARKAAAESEQTSAGKEAK